MQMKIGTDAAQLFLAHSSDSCICALYLRINGLNFNVNIIARYLAVLTCLLNYFLNLHAHVIPLTLKVVPIYILPDLIEKPVASKLHSSLQIAVRR